MNEDWINMVIEDFKETVIFETEYEEGMRCHYQDAVNWLRKILERNQELLHQELQKAREEERERCCDIIASHCSLAMEHGKNDDIKRFASSLANRLYVVINMQEESQIELLEHYQDGKLVSRKANGKEILDHSELDQDKK